jgi:fucose 4-O-acetylase-like acetyltransferase
MIPMVESVVTLLSGFAIALFFVIAGLTYNGEKHRGNLRGFAISRGRQLLIPYFSLYTIMMLAFIPLAGLVDTYLTPSEVFFWFLYGAGPPDQATHLWFLPVLFFGLVLFAAIDAATHSISPRARWPLVVLLPVLAFWITDVFSPLLVPWRVNSILLATTFCIVGYEIRRYRQLNSWRTKSKVRDSAVFLILSVVLAVTSQLNGFVNFVMDSFGTNAWFYMITGTSGTIAVFMLSTVFEQLPSVSRAMRYLGEHSQVIYEIHPIFFYLVPSSLVLLGWSLADVGAAFNYFWPVRFVLALGFSIPFALIVSKSRILSLIFTGRSMR